MTNEIPTTTSGYAFCDTVNDPKTIDPPTNTGGGSTTTLPGDSVLSDYVEAEECDDPPTNDGG